MSYPKFDEQCSRPEKEMVEWFYRLFLARIFSCRDLIYRVHDLSKNVSSKILSYHTKMAINQIFTVEEQPLLSSTAQACSAELYSGTM
jgi:hypothetical protein